MGSRGVDDGPCEDAPVPRLPLEGQGRRQQGQRLARARRGLQKAVLTVQETVQGLETKQVRLFVYYSIQKLVLFHFMAIIGHTFPITGFFVKKFSIGMPHTVGNLRLSSRT